MKSELTKLVVGWFVFLLVVGGGVWAYVALTSTGTVTVQEPLSFVGDSIFDVQLYPQESTTVQLTIANASSRSLTVSLVSTITPVPGAKGLTVTIPKNVTVPATGQVTIDIDISAGKSAEPQAYTVEIQVDR